MKLFHEICRNIKEYLPLKDLIFEAFQTIDPTFRYNNCSLRYFRDILLKRFVRCYNFADYSSLIDQYMNFTKASNENLQMNKYDSKLIDFLKVEDFWVDILKTRKDFDKLSKFMINLMLIPHSNCFIERMFSHVSIIKNGIRNQLDVATVASLIKIKSFYIDQKELFEPTKDHYDLYHNYRTSSFTRSSYFVPNMCDSQGINVNMIFNEFSKKSLVYEGRG